MPKNVSIEILSAAIRDRPRHFGDPSRRSQGKLAKTPDREARSNVTKPRVTVKREQPIYRSTTLYQREVALSCNEQQSIDPLAGDRGIILSCNRILLAS
jgi:hypothetical protein